MKLARYGSLALAGAALLWAAAPVAAQVDDGRWLPFVGCWEAAGETAEAGLLCFRPAEGGVDMESVVEGEVVATERLVADGAARAIVAEGCEGTESVVFAEDGSRAFTESRIECGGESRSGTGVMAMSSPSSWIDVRALTMRGETVSWIQHYRLVGPERLAEEGVDDPAAGLEAAVRPARMIASRGIDAADVTEAVRRVDEEVVVAWVAARSDRFELSGEELVRLADAGVPESVIDVMVAVSYPERFVVEADRPAEAGDMPVTGRRIPIQVGYRSYLMYDPWDPFGSFRYRYGYGYSGFGYSPYGYGYGGYWGGYYPTYGSRVIVRVEPRETVRQGRAVFGRGWTRSSGGGGPAARPRDSSGSGSVGAGSGGSGGSTASGSTRRRAKPRGGR